MSFFSFFCFFFFFFGGGGGWGLGGGGGEGGTDNSLYTDTRYNDTIYYNNNLTVTKPSLKR